jgi:hypothetical protein
MLKNPQDAFAQLVEECRLGWVFRCVLHDDPPSPRYRNGRTWTEYVMHRPGVDVATLPVFYLGEMPYQMHIETLNSVMDTVTDGAFRLPYPRCGFMYRLTTGNPALDIAAVFGNTSDVAERYSLTVAEQDEDGSVVCYSFILRDGNEHWMQQVWQARILATGDIEIAHNQSHEIDLALLLASARNRIEMFMIDCHTLMHRKRGTYTPGVGTVASASIDQRRMRLKLEPVARIRIIDLSAPDDTDEPKTRRAGAKGVPKTPHYTLGTWRNYRDGRRVWIPAYATGTLRGQPIPPWYEVRNDPPPA